MPYSASQVVNICRRVSDVHRALALGAVQGEPVHGLAQEHGGVRQGQRDVDLAQGVDQVREAALAAGLGQLAGQVLVHRRGVRQHALGNQPVHDLFSTVSMSHETSRAAIDVGGCRAPVACPASWRWIVVRRSAGPDGVGSGSSMVVQSDDGSAAVEFLAEGCVVMVEGGDDGGGGIEAALELGPLAFEGPHLDT